jgi:hypothetical protein
LAPGFDPPKVLIAREDTDGMQAVMRYYKKWGDEQQGFETTHTVELEPKANGLAVDRVELSAFGLPEGCRLELECAREWLDPRFIELRIEGPKETVAAILVDFEAAFGGTRLDPANVRMTLVSGEVSLTAGATQAALMKAEMVLDIEPENIEALLLRAKSLQALRQTTQTRETLSHLLRVDPENIEGQALLAQMSTQ